MASLSEVLRRKQAHRSQQKDHKVINDLAETKIRLRKLQELENERKIAEEKIRIQLEKERLEAEEKARLEAERIHKTVDYFDFDHLSRKIAPKGSPKYYGDNIKSCGTWIPHGKGDLYFNDQLIYRGEYRHGIMHGIGVWTTENGSIWEGEMKMGKMHGVGYYTPAPKSDGSPGERKEALMRDNLLCCYHSDLQDGLEVEIKDFSLQHVTIISWNYGWNYLCRFHSEERPRQRNIDFSQLIWFKILHHRPRCYPLTRFGIEMDQPQTYDYWKDTFNVSSRPKLGFAGGRATANMTPLHAPILPIEKRLESNYQENDFESLEMGIGLSLLEKEKEKLVEKKKQMWADALAAKRKEEAELKEKLLLEEQNKLLEEAAEIKEKKMKEKIELENLKKMQLEAESETWEDNQAQLNALRLDRQLSKKNISENSLKRSPSIVPISSDANVWRLTRQVSESPLHRKVSRTLTRIDSRYQHNRKNKDPDRDIFEEGVLSILNAFVQFNPQQDAEDIPLFQKVPAFVTFSLDSTSQSQQRSESVIPLQEEVNRAYQWTPTQLQAVSLRVTADLLDFGSLEITIFEDVKGRKPLKLASGLINFDAVKKEIGQEVAVETRMTENDVDKGHLRLTLKIKDTTIARRR